MKKLLGELFLLTMILSVTSCSNDYDPFADGNYRLHKEKEKPMMKTIKISFGGDFITESEEPLLRAEEHHTYKAVNVFWTEEKDGATEQQYAYGLFVDTDDVNINLLSGYKYRFEATILIDDRDNVELLNDKYSYPFRLKQSGNANAGNGFDPANTDKFIYTEEEKAKYKSYYNSFTDLTSGESHVRLAGDKEGSSVNRMVYPRVKRFYENVDYELGENDSIVTLGMKYRCFGLNILIEKLPFGTLSVEDITNASTEWQKNLLFPKDLVFEATGESQDDESSEMQSYQGLFSMHSMTAESASFTLKFTWNKGPGLSSKTFTRNIEVHPKKNKILKLDLTGDQHESTSGNIVFIMEDDTLVDEEDQYIEYDENDSSTWQ